MTKVKQIALSQLTRDQKQYGLIEIALNLFIENNPDVLDYYIKLYTGIMICNLCQFPGLRLGKESLAKLFELLNSPDITITLYASKAIHYIISYNDDIIINKQTMITTSTNSNPYTFHRA